MVCQVLRGRGLEGGLVLLEALGQVGLVDALTGAVLDLADGAADLAGQGGEPGLPGVAGAEVVDRREQVSVVFDPVALEREREPDLEQVQRLEQQVVGCG